MGCFSRLLILEVEEIRNRVDDLHLGQTNTDSKIESDLTIPPIQSPVTPLLEPKPIVFSGAALPSSQISSHTLKDPDELAVIHATDDGYTSFALKLACHTYFGTSVLEQCTFMGEQVRLGLPRAELLALQTLLFRMSKDYESSNHFVTSVLMLLEPAAEN